MMEFSEKLLCLRKQRGLTQEALAASIYVSRTAISKWESGRGYPSIDSLKALSAFFSISMDELLSGEEILILAETDHQEKRDRLYSTLFGLLDSAAILFLFLPLFSQTSPAGIQPVALPAWTGVQPWLKTTCIVLIAGTLLLGIAALLRSRKQVLRKQVHRSASLLLSGCTTVLLILCRQPYGAILALFFLAGKGYLALNMR